MTNAKYESLVTQIKICVQCDLSKTRKQAVPGEGSLNSKIMFIGEAPGASEDAEGKPFVGPAGKVLNEMLQSIGLTREQVYITNIVKCRPPNNRDPNPQEIDRCWKYLEEQMSIIDPEIIVTLGRHSLGNFFPGELISRVRGKPRRWKNRTIFPVYHPAATLHNPRLRPALQEDFQNISSLISNFNSDIDAKTSKDQEDLQLSLEFNTNHTSTPKEPSDTQQKVSKNIKQQRLI